MPTSKSESETVSKKVSSETPFHALDAQTEEILKSDKKTDPSFDPIAEARRVDELANWSPTAQQTAREDEGRHRRKEEVGTFGVTDAPSSKDKQI